MSDSETNLYSPPQAEIFPSTNLASPWIRLGAQIIDGLILLPLNYVITKLLFTVDQAAVNEAALKGDVLGAMKLASPPFYMVILASLISIALLIGINWKFLQKGQTIGKLALKLQIQPKLGSGPLPAMTIITKRILPLYLVASIPFVGGIIALVDCLLIFRAGHNTLHDDIAGSKVVKLPA